MISDQAATGLEKRVLDNLSTAILLFDREFNLRYINMSAEMLFGISARKILGTPAGELISCSGNVVHENLERSLKTGQPFTEREHQLFVHEGNEITVDCTVIPIRSGQYVNEFLVEIQQVDRQLRISREEQLLARNQASRALVRGLAHEIKNPLGGLRGAAQLLERELPNASLAEYTQIIIEEADRLQNLVDRMLGPNKIPVMQPVNIHQVLERVCNLVQAETGPALAINKDYDPSIPELKADTDQLIQAFLNILRNGVRAAGPSGIIEINTRVLRQFTIGNIRHRLVVAVEFSDNGPGIPLDLQERVFFPLVSGSDGMGLGLSISQTLINRHHGLIEFTSKPGHTVFRVLLPLEQVDG
ncbi:MAG: two-component system sensor histidine kinase NtrB [gamma proteobacterium symbiont of Ctena orbiculata]|uniref:Sensory histidine kinase/phosphatase NtrB n=1 Tax=Candidatus Thiodiazotropha taylori TaxID=2792791 RepID=A0A944QT51_9GAMM|nr:nitrogen regulation protein NR(II) [Candidatus Thiodiazotropha taylori]PUB88780.1 MAG: nitrogen regulation protein NR(II) [gamma proteobacterium symbiont of Ctena orbiculata]MBT2989598.1 nitrogen regulation protein NR(II) [Candidatus Thiodiazotropha taylori]MBT2997178.1 nitrogen regulation protein NR(II) [Candidatus Thiodiazotropha taylori]MBT3001331.1 nitrogen regulation protein NR(II) [Candidatus Thiodiazotropha taylori]